MVSRFFLSADRAKEKAKIPEKYGLFRLIGVRIDTRKELIQAVGGVVSVGLTYVRVNITCHRDTAMSKQLLGVFIVKTMAACGVRPAVHISSISPQREHTGVINGFFSSHV